MFPDTCRMLLPLRTTVVPAPPTSTCFEQAADAVVSKINQLRQNVGNRALRTAYAHGIVAEWHACCMVDINRVLDLPVTCRLLRLLNAYEADVVTTSLWTRGPPDIVAEALVDELLKQTDHQRLIYCSRFNAIGCGVKVALRSPARYLTCVLSHMSLWCGRAQTGVVAGFPRRGWKGGGGRGRGGREVGCEKTGAGRLGRAPPPAVVT